MSHFAPSLAVRSVAESSSHKVIPRFNRCGREDAWDTSRVAWETNGFGRCGYTFVGKLDLEYNTRDHNRNRYKWHLLLQRPHKFTTLRQPKKNGLEP